MSVRWSDILQAWTELCRPLLIASPVEVLPATRRTEPPPTERLLSSEMACGSEVGSRQPLSDEVMAALARGQPAHAPWHGPVVLPWQPAASCEQRTFGK